jgi:hypothetical protein
MWFDEDIEIIIESDVFVNISGINEFSQIDIVEVDTNEDIIIVQVSDSVGPVQSVNGKIGFVNIDKTDIGLSNVENISIIGVSGVLRNDIENLGKDVVYTTGYQEISGYKYFVEGLDSNYIALYPYGSDDSSFLTFVNKTGGAVDLYIDNVAQYNALRIPNKDGTLLTAEELLERNILFNSGTQIISGLKIVSGQYPPSDEYSIDDIRESGAYFFIDDAERFQYHIIAPASQNNYVKFGPYSLGKLHKDTADLFFTTNGLVNTTNSLSNEISGVSGELQNQIDSLSGAVTSVNGRTGVVVLDSSDINYNKLYFSITGSNSLINGNFTLVQIHESSRFIYTLLGYGYGDDRRIATWSTPNNRWELRAYQPNNNFTLLYFNTGASIYPPQTGWTANAGVTEPAPIIVYDSPLTAEDTFSLLITEDFRLEERINNTSSLVPQGGAYPLNNPSGFITGVDLTPYATNLNLAATGSTLNTRIDNLSGTLIDEYVTKTSGQFTTRPTVNGTGVLLTEDVAEYVFPNDLIVSLSSGKTFGRYRDGDTILASGKTTSEILQLAIVEPINPDVSLTTSTPTILFNQTGISNILNANTVIKSLNSNVETGFLEWRRGGVGEWAQLTGNSLTGFTFFHTLTDSNFNTSGFNYRYIVIDTVGATNTGNLTITPVAYVSPSLSSTSVGSSPVDLGNISGTLSTTINKNSPNVNITGYQLQYQTGTNWVNIGSLTSISSTPYSLSVIHNDSNLKNITSINYRIQVYDQYQLNTLTMGSRSFLYRNYLGYSPNTILTLSEIELLSNSTLSNSKTRTISNVTAGVGNYTYYCYRAAAGDLTSIIQDGAAPVLGAFTKLSDVVGTNAYGASVTYRVYRSNATNAFTSNTLSFS